MIRLQPYLSTKPSRKGLLMRPQAPIRPREQAIWYPCTQMKDLETCPPLEVIRAEGCYITLANGQRLIDAISSWWCKSLGHGHPTLKAALKKQLDQFEHVLHPHTTHETISNL